MLLAAHRSHADKAMKHRERLVERYREKVKKFQNYKNPQLGIMKAINPLEILEGTGGGPKAMDPILATKTVQLMENFITKTKEVESLNETSRASLPAWVKNGLALIASAQADDITDRVISTQVMSNRFGRIHFLDVVSERSKGNVPDRARLFDALAGFRGTQDFSSENILGETLGQAGSATYAPVAAYAPVIPGTFVMTSGSLQIRDDRNGNLIGDIGAPAPGFTNTIDYVTGQVQVVFSGITTAIVSAEYQYNIEAALVLPEYGIQIRSRDVQARPRALGASWSQQSIMDFMNDYGINAEPTIIEAGARLISIEKFKHVVNTLRANAQGGTVVFDNTAPVAVSYRDHLKTLGIYISRLQDLIYEATQVVRPNVMVIHPSIVFAIAYQDGFQGQKFTNDGVGGPRFIGRLTNHDMDIFVDPTYPRGQALVTHRGPEFVSTAAIMATYVPLYKAPVHVRGFRKDFALLSEYALEIINPLQLGTLLITNL